MARWRDVCRDPLNLGTAGLVETVRQVINAPVRKPRHAGTARIGAPLASGKGSRRSVHPAPARGREIESRSSPSLALSSLSVPLTIPPSSRSVLLPPRGALRSFDTVSSRRTALASLPLSFDVFLFSSFSSFPSPSTGSSRRRPAGFTPANRFNLTSRIYVSLGARAARGSSSRIPEFAPVG